MIKLRRSTMLLGLIAVAGGCLATHAAEARGAAASIMNSPGYQRRLQESRGYVTNQSGSLFSAPAVSAEPRPHVRPKRRHRH